MWTTREDSFNRIPRRLPVFTALSAICLMSLACDSPEEATEAPPIGWAEFELQATRTYEGRTIYVVEGDLAVTHDQLREYYNRFVNPAVEVDRIFDTTASPLIVNLFGGQQDVWSPAQRFNLRFCVSTDFGALYTRAVNEMGTATAKWEQTGDFDFHYVPAEDGNCTNANPNVTFAVRPWSSGGACAFFPSGGGCVPRTIVIDYNDFDTNPNWDQLAPNITTEGVLIHELGHALGWRHEHIRVVGGCSESPNWAVLTPYDAESTMHYPWCPGGVMTSTLQLTERDGEGAANAYGWFTNMNDVDRRLEPASQGDAFTFNDMAQSMTAPFDVTIRHVDICAWGTYGPSNVTLRSGDDINGPIIASSTGVVRLKALCGWGTAEYRWYRATFPDTTLSAGSSYTARMSKRGQVMGLVINTSNAYSGGSMWDTYQGSRNFPTWEGFMRFVRPAP